METMWKKRVNTLFNDNNMTINNKHTADINTNSAWSCVAFSFCPSLGVIFSNGKYKHLSPKASAVLNVMCINAPRIINKFDILNIVWRNQEISDTAVADAIRTIRKALNVNKNSIETVPKQGYRITHELQIIDLKEFEKLDKLKPKQINKNHILIFSFLIMFIGIINWGILTQGNNNKSSFEDDLYNRAISFYSRYNEEGNIKAIEILEQGIQQYPQSSRLFSALADAYSQLVSRYLNTYNGKITHQTALEYAHKAIEIDEQSHTAWKSLGLINAVTGEYSKAISAYKKALTIKPDYYHANNNLAHLLRIKGDISQALKLFMSVVDVNKSDPYLYFHIGNCYRDIGLFDVANQWYEKGMQLKPDELIDMYDYFINLLFN